MALKKKADDEDRNNLEERLKRRLLAIIPPGTKVTPELYEEAKAELLEELKEEFAAHDVPKAFVEIIAVMILPKKPNANP